MCFCLPDHHGRFDPYPGGNGPAATAGALGGPGVTLSAWLAAIAWLWSCVGGGALGSAAGTAGAGIRTGVSELGPSLPSVGMELLEDAAENQRMRKKIEKTTLNGCFPPHYLTNA